MNELVAVGGGEELLWL